jgi:hypothetical protein
VAATVVGHTSLGLQRLKRLKDATPASAKNGQKNKKAGAKRIVEEEIFRCLFLAYSCPSATPCPILVRRGRLPAPQSGCFVPDAPMEVASLPAMEAQLCHQCPQGCCVSHLTPVSAQDLVAFSARVKSHQSRHIFVNFILAPLCVTSDGFPDKVIFPGREAKSTMV